jgi:ATP-dependent Lon protease
MIEKSKSKSSPKTTKERLLLPVITSETTTLLPGETAVIQLWKPDELAAIEECQRTDRLLAFAFADISKTGSKRTVLNQMGVMAELLSVEKAPGDSQMVLLRGKERIALLSVKKRTPYPTVSAAPIDDSATVSSGITRSLDNIIDKLEQLAAHHPEYSDSLLSTARINREVPHLFVDRLAARPQFPHKFKREIIEAPTVASRLKKILKFLETEIDRLYSIETKKITSVVAGIQTVDMESNELRNPVVAQLKDEVKKNSKLPLEAYDRCLIEIDRLGHLSTASAEYGTTRQYIDWLLGLPWNVCSGKRLNVRRAEKVIDREYYGSQSIKERILERIAITRLRGDHNDGPVLTLAGVPGTGKASLARAIAVALDRKFIRLSVGGVDEISDIKGSARTNLAAAPGIFIRAFRNAGVADPVIFIEDIDSFTEDAGTALAMSLLEVIDPRNNARFLDDYLGIPFDLSKAFFICAVRSTENVPEIYSHRLDVIELPGYIEREKIHIARKYLVPKLLEMHGLSSRELVFTDGGFKKVIRNYTMEAGLLKFKRRLERICRHVAKEKAIKPIKKTAVNRNTVESFLGIPQYQPEKPDKSPEIGVAVGLAWTGAGGDLMIIEGLRMKGSGEVITTGSLGDIMKESIQAAHSYVRSKADVLGIDHSDFDNFDIHIHFPSGAIPKDGPSAGIAVSLVIASVMAERPIRNDIAVTGEVTLRGKVLQVGGLIEKISAAYRAGIKTVFIPRGNKKELKNMPPDIIKKTKFIFIETVDEVFARGMLDFVPSSYTLEKIFAEEMKKAITRKKPRSRRKISAKSSPKK